MWMASPWLGGQASMILAGPTQALSGSPPPKPFPRQRRSGTTPSWRKAKRAPVRPSPVKISSKMRRALAFQVRSARASRYPGGGIRTPALPWIGSMMTAPTSSPPSPSRRSQRTLSRLF